MINIITTATPRAALHWAGLFPAVTVIAEAHPVRWFVNLDAPERFLEDVPKCKYLFRKFSEKYGIELILRVNGEDPSFKTAAKRMFEKCEANSGDELFMWLEDDWRLDRPDALLLKIEEMQTGQHDFITTTQYTFVGGNPCLFRRPLLNKICDIYRLGILKDPELTIFKAKKALCGDAEWREPIPDYSRIPGTFTDIGRDWRSERGIKKHNKYDDNTTQTWS